MIDLGTGNNNKITGPSRTSKSSLTLLRQFTVGRGRVVVWSLHPKTTPLSTDTKPLVVGWRFTKGHISKTCCNEHKSFELLRILWSMHKEFQVASDMWYGLQSGHSSASLTYTRYMKVKQGNCLKSWTWKHISVLIYICPLWLSYYFLHWLHKNGITHAKSLSDGLVWKLFWSFIFWTCLILRRLILLQLQWFSKFICSFLLRNCLLNDDWDG